MQIEILISFIGYMLVMLAIGFYFYFKTSDLSELLPGFVLSWIAILLFSKYGKSNPDSVVKKFDEVQNRLKS